MVYENCCLKPRGTLRGRGVMDREQHGDPSIEKPNTEPLLWTNLTPSRTKCALYREGGGSVRNSASPLKKMRFKLIYTKLIR